MQMHYGPSAVDETDLTHLNLFFAEDPIQREVDLLIMSTRSLTEPFVIPANTTPTFHGIFEIKDDISVLSILPHCHLLGQAWEVYAVSANGNDTIPMISIPEWDFNWQGMFSYPSLKLIPAGYKIHAFCTYDNTANNPNNPHDPPEWMSWGDLTGDEMFVVFFQFVDYLPGDENIVLSAADEDTRIVYQTDNLFPAWPISNRSGQEVTISFHLNEGADVTLDLLDFRGRLVDAWLLEQSFAAGHHYRTFVLGELNAGTYFYRMTTSLGTVRSHVIQIFD